MNKSGTANQIIAHPTGGGAIKGLGETFAPDLHTGCRAALNWETQPRELYLNKRPAIMFTLRDLSSKK
jgi:hypothetical protein